MSYIQIINEQEATGELAVLYKRYSNPDGSVDNVLRVHSLNPESLASHCALYVQSCHRPGPVSRAEREMVGVTVSRLNGCAYCQTHPAAGLKRLLPEDRRHLAGEVYNGEYSGLSERERAMCVYADKLTRTPDTITARDTESLRQAGLNDREILDVAQVAAYFAYANRIVLGLGASLEDEGALGHVPEESRG